MLKKIFLIILLLNLSSCKWFTEAGAPFFANMKIHVPKGTPSFQKGFYDGCSTTLYSRGNVLYRNIYGYRYDPKMITNPEYRMGHQRGYNYCFVMVLQYESGPRGSPDRVLFPHGYDDTFNAGDINDAWGGFFKQGIATPIGVTSGNGLDGLFDMWSGGEGGGVFSANPLWAGGSKGQFFGQ
jgi:hypothetical protein